LKNVSEAQKAWSPTQCRSFCAERQVVPRAAGASGHPVLKNISRFSVTIIRKRAGCVSLPNILVKIIFSRYYMGTMAEKRSSIVVVMGHVDHGKTTLLDYIRKTNVTAKEAGGITQSIGAYEITHPSTSSGQARKITFIDTPGHEAFVKMRARGAGVADLAILVVAADDGVKPQTKESIKILKETETPFVVAINKIDKPNADVERTKADLMKEDVLLEGFGGSISWQAISAKTGQGVNELLDLVLLSAEVEDFVYNPENKARGVIVEVEQSSSRGIEVSAVVKDGVLRVGDEIATPTAAGRVKILENFLGKRVKELSPSSPALIIGFENLPQVGEEFMAGNVVLNVLETPPRLKAIPKTGAINIILRADVAGSLEAIADILKALQGIEIIDATVGKVTGGDVQLAISTGAVIVNFKSKVEKSAEIFAKNNEVRIISSEIIYKLVKTIEDLLKEGVKEIKGELEILAVFSKKGNRQVVGGRATKGMLRKGRAEIWKGEERLGDGKILNLQESKKDVTQLSVDKEGGLFVDSAVIIEKGHRVIQK